MKEKFEEFIFNRINKPNTSDVEDILSFFHERTFEKGELFKEGNTRIDKLGFLADGSARSFFINEKGNEITDQILQKNNFLSDIISVRTGEPSPTNRGDPGEIRSPNGSYGRCVELAQ